MKVIARYVLYLLLMTVAACSTKAPDIAAMTSVAGREHVLAGKIWDVRAGQFLTSDQLASRLKRPDYILLGEIHDNPDHHLIQAWVLQAMADRNRRPAVVFEMVGLDQAGALELYQEKDRYDADALDRYLEWDKSGWPTWDMYRPIFDTALLNGMRLYAGNLPTETAREMARKDGKVQDQALAEKLDLPDPIPPLLRAAIEQDIRDAHCNGLPENLIQPFVSVQFTRDAVMAMSMAAHMGRDGAILIAGNGHVRRDRGVPWHLQRRYPKKTSVSLASVEVVPGQNDPKDYAQSWRTEALPFDYVWFTPGSDRADPCAAFQK